MPAVFASHSYATCLSVAAIACGSAAFAQLLLPPPNTSCWIVHLCVGRASRRPPHRRMPLSVTSFPSLAIVTVSSLQAAVKLALNASAVCCDIVVQDSSPHQSCTAAVTCCVLQAVICCCPAVFECVCSLLPSHLSVAAAICCPASSDTIYAVQLSLNAAAVCCIPSHLSVATATCCVVRAAVHVAAS
jgi:hypothetical protein